MIINYLPIRSNTLFQHFPTSVKDGVVFCAGVTHEHEFRVISELHILRMVYIAISIFLSVIKLLSFVNTSLNTIPYIDMSVCFFYTYHSCNSFYVGASYLY